jgi:hypothetical protein
VGALSLLPHRKLPQKPQTSCPASTLLRLHPTARFTLSNQSFDKPDVRGPALDDSVEPIHATFGMEATPAATDKSLREQAESFLKEFSVVDPATYTADDIYL